jgi:ATPase inhibitor, mitochondrial
LHSDAFTKREKANEDYAIRMREKEKLMELKKKLQEQHEHLKKLEEHMFVSNHPLPPQ